MIPAFSRARPKRTIVFALWDGEEEGLWRSAYYGRKPVFPMEKTIANINLDMVGNGDVGDMASLGADFLWLLRQLKPAAF
ncbi:MAG: M28 family peptidase [Acidobacteriota bacterium]